MLSLCSWIVFRRHFLHVLWFVNVRRPPPLRRDVTTRSVQYARSQLIGLRCAVGSKSKIYVAGLLHYRGKRGGAWPRQRQSRVNVYQHDPNTHVGRIQHVFQRRRSPVRPVRAATARERVLVAVKRATYDRPLPTPRPRVLTSDEINFRYVTPQYRYPWYCAFAVRPECGGHHQVSE